MAGLKSTALRFGEQTKPWVGGFYVGALGLWIAAGLLAGTQATYNLALVGVAGLLVGQVVTLQLNDSSNCLQRFRANRWVGWLLFGGIVADMALTAVR